jgi:transcriptional antiterminator
MDASILMSSLSSSDYTMTSGKYFNKCVKNIGRSRKYRNDEISKQQEIEVQISFIDYNMGTLPYYITKPVPEI